MLPRRSKGLLLLAVGAAYAVWFILTGIGVPCVFHAVTGLYCPGCGITRCLTSLIQLRLADALRYNAAVVVLLPLLAWVFPRLARKQPLTRWQNRAVWTAAVAMLAFGVARNLPALSILRPPQ